MSSYKHFEALTMRVGTIIDVQLFPEARNPSYKVWIDFGEHGIKKSSAQITHHYTLKSLLEKQIIALVDIPPRQIGPFMSECLILGAADKNGDIVLLEPEKNIPNGERIH